MWNNWDFGAISFVTLLSYYLQVCETQTHTKVPKKQQKHTKRYTAWSSPACAIPHAAPVQCDSSFVNHWSHVFQWPGTAAPPASRYRLFKCSIGERLKFMQGHWGCDNYNHRFLALQWQPFVIFTWVIPAAQGCWQACTDLVACSPLFPMEPPYTPPTPLQPTQAQPDQSQRLTLPLGRSHLSAPLPHARAVKGYKSFSGVYGVERPFVGY